MATRLWQVRRKVSTAILLCNSPMHARLLQPVYLHIKGGFDAFKKLLVPRGNWKIAPVPLFSLW